jgi:hypothetical protein
MDQRFGLSRQQAVQVCFDPVQEFRVERGAVLDDFGKPRDELALWQRLERVHVGDDEARLVERADHVLAGRVIDRRLAAHRGVDLSEQGPWATARAECRA